MESNIEREIYDLRTVLNNIVGTGISLTDKRVLRLSVKLDKLLNVFHKKNRY